MATIALRTLQVRVKKSAANLDKTHKGWHQKITNLDMQRYSCCISGQLELNDGNNVKCAFYLPMYTPIVHKGKELGASGVGFEYHNPAYKILTRLWNHQINTRLSKDKQKRKPRKVAASKPAFHGC